MDRPWDDCKFFVTSGCRNANCKFRHSEVAKKNSTCIEWATGKCRNMTCPKKHLPDIGQTPCRFEFSASGCTNTGCIFKHTLPRKTTDHDLQEKLAAFLAEHDKSKSVATKAEEKTESPPPSDTGSVSDASDSECDLEALRAQALKTQVIQQKTQIVKRKPFDGLQKSRSRSPGSPEEAPKKIKKIQIHRRLGERIQLNTSEDGSRRVIKSKSQYSEDEVSDLSLDELTDEEPEDLRATLNKNKKTEVVRISKPNIKLDRNNQSAVSGRLIRKIDNKSPVKSPVKEKGSRVIRMKKEENRPDSRPSSSEWIERKISVKPKPENKILNRLTGVQPGVNSESDYSDATQSDDSAKPKPKRKPNLAWCNMRQNNQTEEEDLIKRKTSSDNSDLNFDPIGRSVEFTRMISVKGTVQSRLGSNVKARLGGEIQNIQNVRKRLGGVKNRLGEQLRKPEADNEESSENLPKKKKLILIKRKQSPPEINDENSIVLVKKSKTEPPKCRLKPPPAIFKSEKAIDGKAKIDNTSVKLSRPEITVPKPVDNVLSETKKVITNEAKTNNAKISDNFVPQKPLKVTKVSLTDDLEDELLNDEDDLVDLGNEIDDDELFEL